MSIQVPSIKLKPTDALMPQVGLGLYYQEQLTLANEDGKFQRTLARSKCTTPSRLDIDFSMVRKIMTMRGSSTNFFSV